MEQIINEKSLLEDTIEALCEHGLTKEQASAHCTEDFIGCVMNAMFEAQSDYILNSLTHTVMNNIPIKLQSNYTFESSNGDAVAYYTLEPQDLVVGNYVSSFRFGTGRITRIIDDRWFEADMFSGSGCCGANIMQFMHDGRIHLNDNVPSVFKYIKG